MHTFSDSCNLFSSTVRNTIENRASEQESNLRVQVTTRKHFSRMLSSHELYASMSYIMNTFECLGQCFGPVQRTRQEPIQGKARAMWGRRGAGPCTVRGPGLGLDPLRTNRHTRLKTSPSLLRWWAVMKIH